MSKKQYFTNARDINKFRGRKRIVTNTKDVQNAVHGRRTNPTGVRSIRQESMRGQNTGTGDDNIRIQMCEGPDGWYAVGCPPGYIPTISYSEQPAGGGMGSVGQRRCVCVTRTQSQRGRSR